MATPTIIPIHCNPRSHHGPLDICKTTSARTTELEALYPKRGSAWDNRLNIVSFPRPHYYRRNSITGKRERIDKVFCGHCGDYQVREAFYPDPTRPGGLRGYCRTCESAMNHNQYVRRKAQSRKVA